MVLLHLMHKNKVPQLFWNLSLRYVFTAAEFRLQK